MGLPTCRKQPKQTSYSIFSQCTHSESTETFGVQMHSAAKNMKLNSFTATQLEDSIEAS